VAPEHLSAGEVADGRGGVTQHHVPGADENVESLTVVADEGRTTVTRVATGGTAFMTDTAVLARTRLTEHYLCTRTVHMQYSGRQLLLHTTTTSV